MFTEKQLLCEDSERKGQGVALLRSQQWLTAALAGQVSDKVSNVVRNMVFLKGHILMLLSKYFIENIFCGKWESYFTKITDYKKKLNKTV